MEAIMYYVSGQAGQNGIYEGAQATSIYVHADMLNVGISTSLYQLEVSLLL